MKQSAPSTTSQALVVRLDGPGQTDLAADPANGPALLLVRASAGEPGATLDPTDEPRAAATIRTCVSAKISGL